MAVKIIPGQNDLQSTYPELCEEWDYEKNAPLLPTEVSAGSKKNVWWLGKCGHEWDARITRRAREKNGCPYCSGKRVLKGYNDLATINPALAEEWHPYKNKQLSPSEVTQSSGKKAWWLGKCGHEWEATIGSRAKGHGCPFCSNQKILAGYNDLASQYPELLEEWDYEKNVIAPDKISSQSNKKVFWKCYFGHEWETRVCLRARGSRCPVCDKYSSFPEQTLYFYLKAYFPDCVFQDRAIIGRELDVFIPSIKTAIEYDGIQWHKNNASQDLKKALLCKEKGISLVQIREEGLPPILHCKNIIRKAPFTNDTLDEAISELFRLLKTTTSRPIDTESDTQEILQLYQHTFSAEKSLAAKYPELVKEWNFAKNKEIVPEKVSACAQQKAWWICSLGHEWEAAVNARAHGSGCPYCSNRVALPGYNDLATLFPAIAKEWHQTKNGNTVPSEFVSGSVKKMWWKCPAGHSYEMQIVERTKGNSCPYCSHHRVLPGYNDFTTEFPNLLKEWDFKKNKVSPYEVFKNSKMVVWWKGECGHEWQSTIQRRTKQNRCPVCSGNEVIPGINDLQALFPQIASELSADMNKKNAQEIYAYSKTEYFWTCSQGHTYKKAVYLRTKRNSHCAICSGRKVLAGYNDLATLFPAIAKEWHPTKNGEAIPSDFVPGSAKKMWWKCDCGHEFMMSISDRTRYSQTCPKCRSHCPKKDKENEL